MSDQSNGAGSKPATLPSAPLPPYADIGKAAHTVLYGSAAGGQFTLGHKLVASSKTADGLLLDVEVGSANRAVAAAISGAYPGPGYLLSSTVTSSGTASLTAIATSLPVAGLKASAILPLPAANSAKLGLTYARDALNITTSVSGLAAGKPALEVAATAGWQRLVLGSLVELASSSASKAAAPQESSGPALANWGAAVAYNAPDAQLAVMVSDSGRLGKLSALHALRPDTYVAVEVSRPLDLFSRRATTGDGGAGGAASGEKAAAATVFAVGVQRKLPSGALAKVKLDSVGLVTGLYEQKVKDDVAVGLTGQVDVIDLGKPPRVGLALQLVQ